MIPETFYIYREQKHGGVVRWLYHHSMSLTGAVARGAMPPLAILNDFLSCGYDDVDGSIVARFSGCEAEAIPYEGAIIEWEPFALTENEYAELLAYITSLGNVFAIADYGVSNYHDWFTECGRRPNTAK